MERESETDGKGLTSMNENEGETEKKSNEGIYMQKEIVMEKAENKEEEEEKKKII